MAKLARSGNQEKQKLTQPGRIGPSSKPLEGTLESVILSTLRDFQTVGGML